MNAYLNQYQNNQVQTASREQILLMLYDGAIRFVRQAQAAIEAKDLNNKIVYSDKAIAILTEFRNTLDHSIGGEIAANLDALYDFMIREIIQAKLKNSAEPLEPVVRILTELRETWAEAVEIVRQENAASLETAPVAANGNAAQVGY